MLEAVKYKIASPVSKWVDFLVFASIFISSYNFFRYPFEAYFHYLIFIALLPFFFVKYGAPKLVIQVLMIPFFVGIINVGIGNCDQFAFIKVSGGLFISLLFYQYVMLFYNFDVKRLFELYVKWCYWLTILGLIQVVSYQIGFKYGYDYTWIFNKWKITEGGLWEIRVNSIFAEPSQMAIVIAPAVYVAVYNILHKQNFILNKKQSLLLLLGLLLTASSTGYIGAILAFLFVSDSFRVRNVLVGVLIAGAMIFVAYTYVEEFQVRSDSARALWVDQDFRIENTNNSSFVLYNNLHIATENIKEHLFFGTGLGSHETAFEKYSLTNTVVLYDFAFNKQDANSMFVRLMSETGIFGIGVILLFIFRFYIRKQEVKELNEHRIISQALLVIILLTLLRQGNYLLNGFPLIMLMYYYNKWVFNKAKMAIQSREDQDKVELEIIT